MIVVTSRKTKRVGITKSRQRIYLESHHRHHREISTSTGRKFEAGEVRVRFEQR